MSATSERIPRLLALVPYLVQRPGIEASVVAADFAISEELLRKDLEVLFLCGSGTYPEDLIDIDFEGATITVRDSQGVDRPLRLTVDEAVGLIVALRTLAETPGLTDPEPVLRALSKVENAAGAAASPAGAVAVAFEDEDAVLPAVQAALSQGRAMRMTYWTASRDETTERIVDPIRLLVVDGQSYLEAWCRRVEGLRRFHLGRVQDVSVLEEPVQVPPDLDLPELTAGLFRPSEHDLAVTLSLRPAARWIPEYYPVESEQEHADGTAHVTLRVRDTDWIRRLVISQGGAATVISPADLRERVANDARAALELYANG